MNSRYRLGKAPSPPASDNDDDDDGPAASSSGSKKTPEKNTEVKTTKVRKPISDEDEEAPAVKKSWCSISDFVLLENSF